MWMTVSSVCQIRARCSIYSGRSPAMRHTIFSIRSGTAKILPRSSPLSMPVSPVVCCPPRLAFISVARLAILSASLTTQRWRWNSLRVAPCRTPRRLRFPCSQIKWLTFSGHLLLTSQAPGQLRSIGPILSRQFSDIRRRMRLNPTETVVSTQPDEEESLSEQRAQRTNKDTSTPKLCDERLLQLDIAFWTRIPIESRRAAYVISLYLETDHPLLGSFDPEAFIEDLVQCRKARCSSFLVNILLFSGCVSQLSAKMH